MLLLLLLPFSLRLFFICTYNRFRLCRMLLFVLWAMLNKYGTYSSIIVRFLNSDPNDVEEKRWKRERENKKNMLSSKTKSSKFGRKSFYYYMCCRTVSAVVTCLLKNSTKFSIGFSFFFSHSLQAIVLAHVIRNGKIKSNMTKYWRQMKAQHMHTHKKRKIEE